MTDKAQTHRLIEVDALRGLAAMAVVLFHYTWKFEDLFAPAQSPSFVVAHGHYGVNLFFIVSGFVIFMTLERATRPMDFVVSRFSRLFPSYWVAIALTFTITHALGLPNKLVDASSAVANMAMLHALFKVPHVDGVYWTLEVELLFYFGMLALYRLRWLDRIHYALIALMSLRLLYVGLARIAGIDLSWTLSRLLILEYIPWFAIGIAVYLVVARRDTIPTYRPIAIAAFAVATLAVAHSPLIAALACSLGVLVLLAAQGRIPVLRWAPIVWLGTISYPLYLLHENIGWSVQLQILQLGWSLDVSIVIALALSLLLADTLSRFVERPAMRWIRDRYRRSLVGSRT